MQDERFDRAPVCAQSERELADRILAPLAGLVAGDEIDADARLGVLGSVAGPEPEDRGGRPMPQVDSFPSCDRVLDAAQVFLESRVEAPGLRGEERDQGVVRRLRDRGFHRGAAGCERKATVAPVAAGDRVHRIEDRDVDDGHRPARAPGAELLPEDPVLPGRHGRVVEPAGVDRDLVPAPDPARRGAPLLR